MGGQEGQKGKSAYSYNQIYLDPQYRLQKVNKETVTKAFKKEAVKNGEYLVCNGGGTQLKSMQCVVHLRCRCSDPYRGQKINWYTQQLNPASDLRKTSLVNDWNNNRHGKKG